jgi:uncharacterized protein YuzE
MKIQYDLKADALYIYLGEGCVRKTIKTGKNMLVDMGVGERVIGVEFYNVSHLVPQEQLQSVSVELPVR